MKKTIIFAFILLLLQITASAQAKWSYKILPDAPSPDQYKVAFTVKLDEGYYIYSQDNSGEGPLPTVFLFEEAKNIELIDKIEEIGDLKSVNDPIFEMLVKKYAHQAIFIATIKTHEPETKVMLPVDFMVCDNEKCKKLNQVFEFTLSPNSRTQNNEPSAQTDNKKKNQNSPLSNWALGAGFIAIVSIIIAKFARRKKNI